MKIEYMNGEAKKFAKLRDKITEVIACFDFNQPTKAEDADCWLEAGKPVTLGFMQGKAIEALVKGYALPNVSHVGYSNKLAPLGFVAARGHITGTTAGTAHAIDVFAIDDGTALIPVVTRTHDPEKSTLPPIQPRIKRDQFAGIETTPTPEPTL